METVAALAAIRRAGSAAIRRSVVRSEDQRFAVADVPRLPQTGLRGAAIVASAVLAIVVDQTSSAIASVGLPYLSGIVAASPDESTWILTAFNTAYYAMILMSPWMMARIGRTRLMLGSLLGFAAVSTALASVSEYHAFVALRFVQGAFLGCIYVPAALLFFTSLPTRALRYAPPIFVLLSLSAATLGTVIGASVAERFGGGTIFVPGAIATLVTALAIRLTVRAKDAPQRTLVFDGVGLALSLAAFGALQFLANEGERRNWFDDPVVIAVAMLLACALPAFVLYESTLTRYPHVDFRMFARYRNLAIGGIVSVTIGFVGYAVTLYIGFLEIVLGATPTEAGAAVLVRVLAYGVGVPLAFALIVRKIVDLRIVVAVGAVGSAFGLIAFSHAMTSTAEIGSFALMSLAFGLFFGMMNQPMGTLVIGSMPLDLLAAGVSVYKLSAPLGAMIGSAVVGTLLDHRTAAFRSAIAGQITLGSAPIDAYLRAHRGSAAGLGAIVAVQAQTLAYADLTALLGLVVLLVIPVVVFARVAPPTPPPPSPPRTT